MLFDFIHSADEKKMRHRKFSDLPWSSGWEEAEQDALHLEPAAALGQSPPVAKAAPIPPPGRPQQALFQTESMGTGLMYLLGPKMELSHLRMTLQESSLRIKNKVHAVSLAYKTSIDHHLWFINFFGL